MKDFLKSLPWGRFVLMVAISILGGWLAAWATNYQWWFLTGMLGYTLTSFVAFAMLGLDTVSVATLLVDYDDAYETFHAGNTPDIVNDAADCMAELALYARKHHQLDLRTEHRKMRLARHAEDNVVQLFKRS